MANSYPKSSGNTFTAEDANKSITAYIRSGCEVNQGASAVDMVLDLDAGEIYCDGEIITFSATTQTINAADATNPRWDFIGIAVNTTANTATKHYVAGTPAASPTKPGATATSEPVIPLAWVYVPATDTAITDTQISDARPSLGNTFPIGGIMAWAKSLTGVPSLPPGWVECNGQTLTDVDSPLNGTTIPNLNASGGGTQRFLRGSTTSGTTGGADTVTLTTTELPAHTHTIPVDTDGVGSGSAVRGGFSQETTYNTSSSGSGSAFSILNSYYEVVWIMKTRF